MEGEGWEGSIERDVDIWLGDGHGAGRDFRL